MMDVPWALVVGGRRCVMMYLEPGAAKVTDARPSSYMMGFLVALLVLGGWAGRRNANMAGGRDVASIAIRETGAGSGLAVS